MVLAPNVVPFRPSIPALSRGLFLRLHLEVLGVDQSSFAESLGLSRQAINNIANDRNPDLSLQSAAAIAKALGYSTEYWLNNVFTLEDFNSFASQKLAPQTPHGETQALAQGALEQSTPDLTISTAVDAAKVSETPMVRDSIATTILAQSETVQTSAGTFQVFAGGAFAIPLLPGETKVAVAKRLLAKAKLMHDNSGALQNSDTVSLNALKHQLATMVFAKSEIVSMFLANGGAYAPASNAFRKSNRLAILYETATTSKLSVSPLLERFEIDPIEFYFNCFQDG